MSHHQIPILTDADKEFGLQQAKVSPRRRHPKILHQPGAEFNEVFNFNMQDTYMQPHLHPGPEKIEEIHVVQGQIAVLYFNNQGEVSEVHTLKKGEQEMVRVPAFTWHTYVMLTESTISYETMMGKYDPKTWKEYANWAPTENSIEASAYLEKLKKMAVHR